MRSALKKVPGVLDADVALPDKALVKVEKSRNVTSKQLIEAIKKAGFEAKERKEAEKKTS